MRKSQFFPLLLAPVRPVCGPFVFHRVLFVNCIFSVGLPNLFVNCIFSVGLPTLFVKCIFFRRALESFRKNQFFPGGIFRPCPVLIERSECIVNSRRLHGQYLLGCTQRYTLESPFPAIAWPVLAGLHSTLYAGVTLPGHAQNTATHPENYTKEI